MTSPTEPSPTEPSQEEPASDAAPKEAAQRTKRTITSVLWSVGTGIGSRFVSLISTLLVTRYVDPEAYGEVSVAYVVTLLAHIVGSLAIATYVTTHPKATKKDLFHAAVVFHISGIVCLTLVYLLRGPLGVAFGGKNIDPYILGYIVATMFDRMGLIPEATLVRDERFKTGGIISSSCELFYSVLVLVLGIRGFSGHAIVYAGIARSVVRASLFLWVTDVKQWATIHKWDWQTARGILRFGVPMTLAQISGLAARRGDNLAFSKLFGLGRMGAYNLAYNLADVPAATVGERIGDVLVPSFAKLSPEERPAALARSVQGIGFVVFALSAGIAALARPLSLIFNQKWRDIGIEWMLTCLAFLSVGRSIEWAARVFLQVSKATRTVMLIEWGKVLGVMGAIFGIGGLGRALWGDTTGSAVACAAVSATFCVSALVYLGVVSLRTGFSFATLVGAMRKPILCAGGMCIGVRLLDRYALEPFVRWSRPSSVGWALVDRSVLPHWDAAAGVLLGGLAAAALLGLMIYVVARKEASDLIRVLRSGKKRRA